MYLVTYDISGDVRRARAAAALLDLGGQRVRRSVFWSRMDGAALVRFQSALRVLVDMGTDRVHCYRTYGAAPLPTRAPRPSLRPTARARRGFF